MEPEVGEVSEMEGGVLGATTVIVLAAEVVVPPQLSVAFAVIEYVPAAAPFHVTLNAEGGMAVPIQFVPPWKNSTCETSAGELAVALAEIVIGTVVEKLAPLAGAVRLTTGGSGGAWMVMARALEVLMAFELSVAFAVIE
jgi:hypothetical protein